MKRVREDLESLRNLALLCRKRESRKLRQQEIIQKLVAQFFLVKQPELRAALEMIVAYALHGPYFWCFY